MKKEYFCERCGVQKVKGFWELGCSVWGKYFKKHIWKLEDGKFKVLKI